MLKIKWEKQALERHEEWGLIIALEYSLTHSLTYLAEINSATEKIAEFPLIGTKFGTILRANLKRYVTSSGYSIFYEIQKNEKENFIFIVSVIRNFE